MEATCKTEHVSDGKVPLGNIYCCSVKWNGSVLNVLSLVEDSFSLLGSFQAINQNKRPFLKINVRVAPHYFDF